MNGRGFVVLLGHYESFEENDGDLTYVDVKAIPTGIFGNVLLRIINQYETDRFEYMDHFKLSQDGSNHRIVFLFRMLPL